MCLLMTSELMRREKAPHVWILYTILYKINVMEVFHEVFRLRQTENL